MNAKGKGSNAERELVHKFWAAKWACFRSAGSGSNQYPTPDLIAGNNLRKLAIEVKITAFDRQYFDIKEIDELGQFGALFGAEPFVAVKFSKMEWVFLPIEDLEKTPKSYVLSKVIAERRGLKFDELIGK
jgi:holliday junction resolvase Hjr